MASYSCTADGTGEGKIHSSKTNRWGKVINPFLSLLSSLNTCFPPTMPCHQNICDLFYMASKEEVLKQPKCQQLMEVASHPVLVLLVKLSQCPLFGRALAQLLCMVQIPLRTTRGDETEWQYSSSNETMNCYESYYKFAFWGQISVTLLDNINNRLLSRLHPQSPEAATAD